MCTHAHTLSLSLSLFLSTVLYFICGISYVLNSFLPTGLKTLYIYKVWQFNGQNDFCASTVNTDMTWYIMDHGEYVIPQCCIMYSLGFILFCGCSVFCYKCGWQICKWRIPGTCLFVAGTWAPTFQRNLLPVKWWYGNHLPYHFESDSWKHNLNIYCHKTVNSYVAHQLLQ